MDVMSSVLRAISRHPKRVHQAFTGQINTDLGRTIVRIGQHWAALGTTLLPVAEGPFLLGECPGRPEYASRRCGTPGGPGEGELSRSRVEGWVVAVHLPPTFREAGEPRDGSGLCGGMNENVSLV